MKAGTLAIFFLFNLLLTSYFLDSWTNPNTTSRVLQVRSLLENSSLNIDEYHEETIDKSLINGHYYPDKAPMPTFLLFPMYKVLMSLGILPDPERDHNRSIFLLGSFLLSSLPMSLLMLFMCKSLLSQSLPVADALLLSSLPFYSSMIFVYTGTFYSHVLVAFFIVIAYEGIRRGNSYFLSGLLSGAAFFSEYLTAIPAAIWFFQIWFSRGFKRSFLYGLGLLPFVLAFMAYNHALTGNILETAYTHQVYYHMENAGFHWPDLVAGFDLLFSPWRGLIFYVPFLLAFIPLIRASSFCLKKILSDSVLFPIIVFFIAVTSFREWHGGWTYGPRYLIPPVVLFLYAFAGRISELNHKKAWIWAAMAIGLILTLSAKLTVQYSIPSNVKIPWLDSILPAVKSGNWLDTSLLQHFLHVSPGIACTIFVLLMMLYILYLLIQGQGRRIVGTAAKDTFVENDDLRRADG